MDKKNKLVLVDENDKVVGYGEKFAVHKNPVSLHRAISIVIFSFDKKSMLLQKRSTLKPTWPLFWSNTVCSHPRVGESYLEAAKRRIKEEMGFTTELKELYRFIYEAKMNKIWGEHELDTVFEGYYEGKINPDPNEVADHKWMNIEKLREDLIENPGFYTPWFKTIIDRLV